MKVPVENIAAQCLVSNTLLLGGGLSFEQLLQQWYILGV